MTKGVPNDLAFPWMLSDTGGVDRFIPIMHMQTSCRILYSGMLKNHEVALN